MADPYHNRPEWSYSAMKKILDSGIDYAVGARMGLTPKPDSSAIDLGQLVHQTVLGGGDKFVVCPFPDYRTKAARDWKELQLASGHIVITQDMKTAAEKIIEHIKNHPHSKNYLYSTGTKFEQEMFAKTGEGVDLRGKADGIKLVNDDSAVVIDIKTTAQFDKFEKQAYWNHYDLQSAVYTFITAAYKKIDPTLVNYMFCVAETVAPYRVQYMHASLEFVESGERKLRTCIDEIVAFGDKQPNFMLEEIKELGDWSH